MKRTLLLIAFVLLSCCLGVCVYGEEPYLSADVLYGDINKDSKINAADALVVLKHAANIETIEDSDIVIADVTVDEMLNAADALEILKFSAGIIDSFEKLEVIVPAPVEIPVDAEQVKLVKVGGSRDEQFTRLITSVDEYQTFVFDAYKRENEEVAAYYGEDFFTDNNLIATYFYNNGSGQLRQAFSKLEYDSYRDLYITHVNTYTNTYVLPDTGSWCVFVPVDKSIDNAKNFKFVVNYEWEEGTMFELYGADTNLIKVGQAANIPEQVVELNSYEEFAAYVNNMVALVPDAFGGNVDEVLAYYDEATFENQSIAAVNIEETKTADYEMKFLSCTYSGDKYCYEIKAYLDEEYTEGTASWCLFAPVPKAYIRNDEYQLGLIKEYEVVTDTDKSDVVKIAVDTVEDEWYREIILIDTYEEYTEYLNTVEEHLTDDNSGIKDYDENYFNDNILVLVKYVDKSYSIESSYSKITEYPDKYVVYINRYIPNVQHQGAQQWDMLIPLEGKHWSEKEISLGIAETYEEGADTKAKTMWASTIIDPSYGENELPQYIIISSYAEYKEYVAYIDMFLQYTSRTSYDKNRYAESYFENNVLLLVVVEGYEAPYDAEVVSKLTNDGQIELEIDRYHSDRFGNNGSIWNIFVPLPGKDWSASNVTIKYTDTYPSTN